MEAFAPSLCRMPNNNSTTAEMMACLSMILTMDRWLRGQDLHSDMAHFHEHIIDIQGSVTLGNTADFPDYLCEHIEHVISDDEEDGKSTEIDSNSANDGSSSYSSSNAASDTEPEAEASALAPSSAPIQVLNYSEADCKGPLDVYDILSEISHLL